MFKFLVTILVLLGLPVACSILVLEIRGTYIDYDDHIPELHGKKVLFNKKMVYIHIEADSIYFDKEQKKYGIEIVPVWLLNRDHGYRKFKETSVPVPAGMNFTVIKSYWNKSYGFMSSNSGDHYFVVLQDENGVVSTMLWSMFISSSNFTGYDVWEEQLKQ